ncbi:MAG TPA: hypothetical protein V6D09_20945, partial [Leptolyngbyaceae cyanobacterium]
QEKADEITKFITKMKDKSDLSETQQAFIQRKQSTLTRINNSFERQSQTTISAVNRTFWLESVWD